MEKLAMSMCEPCNMCMRMCPLTLGIMGGPPDIGIMGGPPIMCQLLECGSGGVGMD